MSKPGAKRTHAMLARNNALARKVTAGNLPLAALGTVQRFQQERIARTYSDLLDDPGYRPAVDFFLTELYGGLDFLERDHDMEKVMPLMIHFLPDNTLLSLSEAFELQAIGLEFDFAMAEYVHARDMAPLDMARYCAAFRACSDLEGRQHQILLTRDLGFSLKRLVRKPWVNVLVRLLHGPAHAAGFGKLQDFLESGLVSFRTMPDVDSFLETVYEREWDALERLFDGDDNPYGF